MHAAPGEPRQPPFQGRQGLGIGVADADDVAAPPGQTLQAFQLYEDGRLILIVVDEDLPLGCGNPVRPGPLQGHRGVGGAAVDEIEPFFHQHRHHRIHGNAVGGQTRPHVVVDADGGGKQRQVVAQHPLQPPRSHADEHGPRPRVYLGEAMGLHGLVQDQLPAALCGQLGHRPGVGAAGQYRQSDVGLQAGDGQGDRRVVAQVVDDQGEAATAPVRLDRQTRDHGLTGESQRLFLDQVLFVEDRSGTAVRRRGRGLTCLGACRPGGGGGSGGRGGRGPVFLRRWFERQGHTGPGPGGKNGQRRPGDLLFIGGDGRPVRPGAALQEAAQQHRAQEQQQQRDGGGPAEQGRVTGRGRPAGTGVWCGAGQTGGRQRLAVRIVLPCNRPCST